MSNINFITLELKKMIDRHIIVPLTSNLGNIKLFDILPNVVFEGSRGCGKTSIVKSIISWLIC